jgi:hypothetical protein
VCSVDIGSDPKKHGRRGLEEGVEGLPSGSVGLPNPDAATIADSPSRCTLAGLGANTDLCLGRRHAAFTLFSATHHRGTPMVQAIATLACCNPSRFKNPIRAWPLPLAPALDSLVQTCHVTVTLSPALLANRCNTDAAKDRLFDTSSAHD